MTAEQAVHIWRVLLELEGEKDFIVEIRLAEKKPDKKEGAG